MGQSAMAPTGGVVNQALSAFRGANENGPGWLYYGINAADRGLGYNGGYMTLGGFVPYAEDDLGGFWAADLRSHLSEYGGFFSNIGAVRKQFVGGTLFGVGVFWDYDADANQYPTGGALGTSQFGQFGHVYNQVGVSLEWLTDYGNLRSNGYIPVGSTGYTAGSPGNPFFQNFVMCQNGLDAALTGTDLEVGAYIPGLADWAGMVSVGGYAYGNNRNDWQAGPLAGQDIVPWFGGVYTRLDMTFIENWDFSLQANNDSYFDWTGFARLTYRMGGSRRRNVPDQVEQPMMRNEHIVRGHQTPIVACNPNNGNQPWRVVHVNNAAAPGGNGTAEAPFTTLAQGDTAATNPWDIVFVNRGTGTAVGYDTTFSFNAANQSLVGNGQPFLINTSTCGLKNIATSTSGRLPLLSNPAGTSILVDGNVAPGATVANFQITGSKVGIAATGPLTSAAGRPLTVDNVAIAGNGTAAPQFGVVLTDATGKATFTDTSIANMNQVGLYVLRGDADIDYQGAIKNDVSLNGGVSNPLIAIQDTTGGTINLAVGGTPASATVPNEITDVGGGGIQISGNAAATTINMQNLTLTNTVATGIQLTDDNSTTTVVVGAGQGIQKATNGSAISVVGGAPNFAYYGPITNGPPATGATTSYLLSVADTLGGSVLLQSQPGEPFIDTGNGILISNAAGNVDVIGANIASSGSQGVLINSNSVGTFTFTDLTISGASAGGVTIDNTPAATANFNGLNIGLVAANAIGILAVNNGGAINTIGASANNIATASTTQPAVQIDATLVDMSFATVTSGVPQGGGGGAGPWAMEFSGGTTGNFDVTSAFTVGGTQGDATDYVPGGVTVQVPP
jgi:hypothetical protein